jgi:hypothetical protein
VFEALRIVANETSNAKAAHDAKGQRYDIRRKFFRKAGFFRHPIPVLFDQDAAFLG